MMIIWAYFVRTTRGEEILVTSSSLIIAQICLLYTDPIDRLLKRLYCHMAWLIGDNRYLSKSLYTATCSNDTHFDDLDPNGYAYCFSI